MPNPTLTPEILALLQKQLAEQGAGFNGGAQYGGKFYAPVYGQGSYSGADNYTPGALQEWQQYDPIQGASGNESVYNGKTATRFDSQGNYIGDGTFTNVADQTPLKDLAKFAATAAAMYGAGNFINGQFGGTSLGGADTAGPVGAEGEGVDAAVNAADMSRYTLPPSPIGPLPDQMAAITGAGAGVGLGAGSFAGGLTAAELATLGQAAAGGVPSVFRPSVDSASANAGPTDPNAPTGVNTGGGATDWAKWLSDNRSVLQALGLGAGAVMGATPTTTERRSVASMDPRMDRYVYGDGTGSNPTGLLGRAADWYNQNSSGINPTMRKALDQKRGLLEDPNTAAGYKSISQAGLGLLATPVAANPYANGRPPRASLLETYGRRVRRNPDGTVTPI